MKTFQWVLMKLQSGCSQLSSNVEVWEAGFTHRSQVSRKISKFDIYTGWMWKWLVLQHWSKHLWLALRVWFTCGLIMKNVKGNWQEKCGYFLCFNFLLSQRKFQFLSCTCFWESPYLYIWKIMYYYLSWSFFHVYVRKGSKHICSVKMWVISCQCSMITKRQCFSHCPTCGFPLAMAAEQPILCGLWSTNNLWPKRMVGASIVCLLSQPLWLSYFWSQLYYLLLSCCVELFNTWSQHPKDKELWV